MTIVHREGNVHKNADGLSRWPLDNNSDNPAWDAEEIPREVPIMAISITDLKNEFWDQVSESYKENKNTLILYEALSIDFKSHGLLDNLEAPWKKSFDEGRFILLDDLLYHKSKHSSVIVVVSREHIGVILH